MHYVEVKCLHCRQVVRVKLIAYGGGKIARCPKCGKLAFNQKA